MNSEDKYWLSLWLVIMFFIIAVAVIGVFSGYLDDKRDLEMANKGLHKYNVERCTQVTTKDEWHEAGWRDR